jgi:formylmethanofuran dehydrogenase subunit A
MAYDLLIKGGHVLDPGQDLDAALDIAIAGGKIVKIEVVEGDFTFTDTTGREFRGGYGLVPVRTLKAGEEFSPGWGTHPWGWLPASAGDPER